MLTRFLVLIACLLVVGNSFFARFQPSSRAPVTYPHLSDGWLRMSTTEAPPRVVASSSSSGGGGNGNRKSSVGKKSSLTEEQFAKYHVGQKLSGRVISSKQFGCFVDVGEASVLIPRSTLTRGNFEKLTIMASSKATQEVNIELIGLNAQDKTLSGKYLAANAANLKDISTLTGTDYKTRSFPATVVGVHDFGIFVELDEYGVEGLVPRSMLPRGESKPKVGSSISVKIEELGENGKKLLLSMRGASSNGNNAFANIPNTRWIQGIVQSVTNFGIFVRPAGFDATGLVHNSRVPRDLVSSLKHRSPPSTTSDKTDIEMLFSEGDVVKVRVNSVDADAGRVELSMLPYRTSDDDEDDYVVEGRDPEVEEGKFQEQREEEEEEPDFYDAQETLLWWRGSPYIKSPVGVSSDVDDEAEVVMENSAVVEGTWRRMFEVDMREDQADFSTKVREAEMKELEEEIGELGGLDEDMVDFDGLMALGAGASDFKISSNVARLGNFVALSSVPNDWQEEMDFFKGIANAETTKVSQLRKGRASEQSEFEMLLKEVEIELDAVASRGFRRPDDGAGINAGAETEPAATHDA